MFVEKIHTRTIRLEKVPFYQSLIKLYRILLYRLKDLRDSKNNIERQKVRMIDNVCSPRSISSLLQSAPFSVCKGQGGYKIDGEDT